MKRLRQSPWWPIWRLLLQGCAFHLSIYGTLFLLLWAKRAGLLWVEQWFFNFVWAYLIAMPFLLLGVGVYAWRRQRKLNLCSKETK